MACFEVVGDQLCLRLGPWEKVAALGGDVQVPLSRVTGCWSSTGPGAS